MTFLAPISAAPHVADSVRPPVVHGIGRGELIRATRDRTIRRAIFAAMQKLRLAYKVPYHEWQDALHRAGFRELAGVPYLDEIVIDRLIEEYTPRFDMRSFEPINGPRCAPWAARKYRQC